MKDICEIKDEKNEFSVVEGSELKESLSVLPSTYYKITNLQGNTLLKIYFPNIYIPYISLRE